MWLLEKYDSCGSFRNLSNPRILEFTKEDVHATFGLSMGPKKVVEGKTCDSCEKYNAPLDSWRSRWGISPGGPKIGKMHDGILDRGDHGDEFKRDFVVHVISTCIEGNENGDAYFKILKPLGNVADIINFDRWTKAEVQKRVHNEEQMGGMFGRGSIRGTFDYDKAVQAVKAYLQQYFQDLECERMQKDDARVSLEVIHKHGKLHLSNVINKLITIPVEGSSVLILGVGMCADHGNIGGLGQDKDVDHTQEIGHFDDFADAAAHYHEPESCDRIQVDHPSHTKGKIVGMTNHTNKSGDNKIVLCVSISIFVQV
ncbi:hypothetical protein Cgig2_000869 [Carnegiea gigantea]|uniref:Uncharacterized protein n=1 Tax=Carnegiea gigantea TaxID=171969 RepID=A0A9Q1JZT9_9CARY|nr:hypothetical protein Cgig2_000869 [Carnegiea gigantea]